MKTAIFIDGDFFLRRYRHLYPESKNSTPKEIAQKLYDGLLKNLSEINNGENVDIHRIFFYDCPPLNKRVHNPINGRAIDFGISDLAKFRLEFHEELKHLRKVALRLGRLSKNTQWVIKLDKQKELLNGKIKISDLTEDDVQYHVRQKGVDMRIGLDIASLAYKKTVGQLILISGDSDFMPAAKLARREGMDFVLDPMWNDINPDLYEHTDGIIYGWRNPNEKQNVI